MKYIRGPVIMRELRYYPDGGRHMTRHVRNSLSHKLNFNPSQSRSNHSWQFQDPSGNLNRFTNCERFTRTIHYGRRPLTVIHPWIMGDQFSIVCHTPQKSGRVRLISLQLDVERNKINSTNLKYKVPIFLWKNNSFFILFSPLWVTIAIGGPTYLGIQGMKKRTNQTVQVMNDQLAHLGKSTRGWKFYSKDYLSRPPWTGKKSNRLWKKWKLIFDSALNETNATKNSCKRWPAWFFSHGTIGIKISCK